MTYAPDSSTLLNLFHRLVESQAGKKIGQEDQWLNDAQVLAVKLFRHISSMQTLACGAIDPVSGSAAFIDNSSIKVICRAALETYLVFYYLYGTKDDSLSKFRHLAWVLGGLQDRQKFHVSTQENRQLLLDERAQIEALQKEVSASPWFQQYSTKQQNKLLAGDWRIGKHWHDLAADAGFHEKYFNNIYSYLCGYSHSSYLSALQVGQARTLEVQHQLTQAILGIGVVLMSHFAFSYTELFKGAKIELDADPLAVVIAKKWHSSHEEMAKYFAPQ